MDKSHAVITIDLKNCVTNASVGVNSEGATKCVPTIGLKSSS